MNLSIKVMIGGIVLWLILGCPSPWWILVIWIVMCLAMNRAEDDHKDWEDKDSEN